MSLMDIKSKNQGFTIVELLIVVVVIAILAAITIVSYNGITNRANKSSAVTSASTFQKKAELYAGDDTINRYPVTAAEISADSSKPWYMDSTNVTYAASTGSLSASNGKNTVVVRKCAAGTPANQAAITSSNVTGLQIYYFDFDTSAVTTTPKTVGINTSSATTCPTS